MINHHCIECNNYKLDIVKHEIVIAINIGKQTHQNIMHRNF